MSQPMIASVLSNNMKTVFSILAVLSMMTAAFIAIAPTGVDATVRPGGTLKNDQPARVYQTGWWWSETPDELLFKVPAKTNYYSAIAIRNRVSGEDFDLFAYDDYDMTKRIASSTKGSNVIDLTVIDGHTYTGDEKYAKVIKFTGQDWSSGIAIESDYHCVEADLYGSDTDDDGDIGIGTYRESMFEYHGTSTYDGTLRGDYPLINMYDVKLGAGGYYKFDIDSVPSVEKLSMYLFKGSGNLDSALKYYKAASAGNSLTFTFEPEISGDYGLAVVDESYASGYTSSDTYRILVSSDFSMAATPTNKLIAPGMGASYKIDVSSLGITKDVNLHYRWRSATANISTPSGAIAKLNVNKVTPGGVTTKSAYLNVTTTSSMTAGTYYLEVYGNDTGVNGKKHSVRVVLRVSTSPDFFLSTTPDLRIISPGTDAKFTVTMATINSFSSDVTLSAAATPSSSTFSYSFSPTKINASNPTSTLTISTKTTSPVGLYSIEVKGTGGSLTRYANTSMRIKDPIIIDLIAPVTDELVAGVYLFKAKAGTPTDVKSVKISFGGKMETAGTLNMYYSTATGFWERSVNTYTFADGSCSLNISAEDYGGGVTKLGPVNFTLSNSAPNPIIKTPLDRSYVTGTSMNIKVNTTSYVIACRFKVDQNAWTPLLRSGNTWTGTYDTTQITDGAHTLTIDAKDSAGLSGETSITIFVDNNKPTCNLNSPIEGQYIEGSYTFRVVATDTVGVHHVNINIFGGSITLPYNPITSSYEYTVSTNTMTDGTYKVYATAFDNVNLSMNSNTITFQIDNNGPSLQINQPVDGSIIGGHYTLSATAGDLFLNSVEYRIDSTGWQNFSGTEPDWKVVLNTTTLIDGAHKLHVRAKDNASHMTEQSIDFIVDNTAPTCNIVTPFEGAFVEGVHTFQVSSSDKVGLDRVVLLVFGDAVQTTLNRQTGYYEYMMNTYNRPDGNFNVWATSYDLSGKTTNSSIVRFKVDNNPPEMTINELQTGDYVSSIVKFNLTVNDAFLQDTRYSIDGGGWLNISVDWDSGKVLDGEHSITFMARDQAGHSTTQSIKVIVDNNAPVCAVNGPVPSEFIKGAYKFRLSAYDQVGMDRVEVNVFGSNFTAIYSMTSGYYEFTSDTSIQKDGNYTCYARAFDKSGKMNISGLVAFQVDNNAPVLRIVHPLDNTFLEGIENLLVNATDVFLDKVEYDIDGSGWVDISIPLNTTIFSDGDHSISFRATDLGGHTTTTSSDVVIDNNLPYGAISDPVIDQFLEGTALFRVVASDLVGIDTVKIEVFGAVLDMNYNSGNGYYEYRTDTRLIPDGTYLLNVSVTDLSGKLVVLGPLQFNLDNHYPELVVNNLANGDILQGMTAFNVTTFDVFLDKVQYQVDTTGWMDISVSLDTTIFQDGDHTLSIRATDLSGKITRFDFDLIIDNLYPTCTITSPVEGEFVEGMVTIRVTAFDLVAVDYVMIKVYNIVARVPFNSQTGYYEYSSNTITWGNGEDGVRNVTAIVYDLTGKSYTYGPVNFKVDNRAPTINIHSPREGQIISGVFFFDVDNGDVFKKGTDYNIDGASWQPVSIAWNSALVTDGDHEVTIRATDLAGHITTEVIHVIVDNHEPEIDLISPTKNEFIGGTYIFRVKAFDQVGITSVLLNFAGEERIVSFNSQSGYHEYIIDTRTLLDGTYYINASVTDVASRTVRTATIPFKVDNRAPDLSVETPVKGQLISGLFVIKAKTTDEFPGLVSYAIDGTTWFEVTTPWDTSKVNDGDHIITIRTIDQAGHRTEFDIAVIVDNTEPVISQATIAPGQIFAGLQTLRFYAYDTIGIRQVTLSIDNANPFEIYKGDGGLYYEYLLNTKVLSDGDHSITVTAIDKAGNMKGSTYAIKIDNTGPEISLDYYWIEGGSPIRIGEVKQGNSVVFTATIIDQSGVGAVMINIDSLGWREMTPDSNTSNPNTFVLFWPTTEEDGGSHVFQIRASDKLGNENSISGLINVKKVEDKTSLFERFIDWLPIIWLFLFIIILVAIILLAYFGILTKWAKGEGRPAKTEEKKDEKRANPKSKPLGKKAADVEEWGVVGEKK